MRFATPYYCLLTLYVALSFCAAAHSQQSENSQTAEPTSANEANEKEQEERHPEQTPKPWENAAEFAASGPDVYLLPDKNGTLRKVLGFRYEDFLRAWQQKDNPQGARPPQYVIESLKASGEAGDSHARLVIELKILPRVDGWLNVTLQLPTFLIQHWEVDGQDDQECLVFDERLQSHVLWLRGKSNEPRTLKLEGMLKLKPTSPGLEIKLPYAATSTFVLRVPVANAQFDASAGLDLQTAPLEDGGVEVTLVGHASPLRVQWRSPDQQEQPSSASVEAVGQLTVQVDERRVRYETALAINSYGKPVERLRVRLPAGAKLAEEQLSEDYRVATSQESPELGASDIVEIALRRPRRKPWTLRLQAEQLRDEKEAGAPCKIEGFEVLDAFRQSGDLALYVDDRLQAYFDLHGDVEQVSDRQSAEPSQLGTRIGSFKYARFPWALEVHTIARRQRTSARPQYELQINPGEAKLQVKLDYDFAGAQMFSVRVDLRGWELTDSPIESDGAVDKSGIIETRQGLLVLPLTNPDVQRVRISMDLRRNMQLGHVTFPLPEPLSASVLPGQLNVKAESSLQVTPTIVATEGVGIAAASKETQTRDNGEGFVEEQEILRLRTFLARATLSADIARRERQIVVDVQTRVDVGQEKIGVSQQLEYHVKYRPVSQLLLQIPGPLWNNDTLQVRLDGEEVQASLGIFSEELPSEEIGQGSESDVLPVRQLVVSLPRPRQNTFVLDLSYEMPCPTLAAEALMPTVLPVVAPEDQVDANLVLVHTMQPIRATLNQTADEVPWKIRVVDEQSEPNAATLELKGSGKPATIPLLLQIEAVKDVKLATLELAWLQTWIVGRVRQDRAAFRFRTPQHRVIAQLPAGFNSAEIEVLLDGSPAEFKLLNNRVVVPLDENEKRKTHTLELRYQSEVSLAGWRNLRTELPLLESRPTSAPVYWQLILPRGWHVANSPKPLNPECWIGWKNYRWGRQPTYNQLDLENLAGATHAPPPAPSSNQYLYRAFEIPREINILIVRQVWMVLTSILAAFGVGMLLVYTPLAKQAMFWLLVALALIALVVIYPEITLLLIQAILWAAVMTLVTLVLKKAFARTPQPETLTALIAKSGSTAVTESWSHGQMKQSYDTDAESISLQTGGSVS